MDQVRYAALDAHCLVGIFEEMLIERGGRLARSGQFLVYKVFFFFICFVLYSKYFFFSFLNGSRGLLMAGSIIDPDPNFSGAVFP